MKSRKSFIQSLTGALTFGWLFSGNEETKAANLDSSSNLMSSDPFVGQIIIFGGNFAPRGWAFCDGQLLPISQFDALFSLLGTTYGGDGSTTFGLPRLRGRIPIHAGTGPGLSDRRLGSNSGSEMHSLTNQEIPSHSHTVRGTSDPGSSNSPVGGLPAVSGDGILHYGAAANENMGSGALTNTGGGQSHNNMQPYLVVNYIIALYGLYPSRN